MSRSYSSLCDLKMSAPGFGRPTAVAMATCAFMYVRKLGCFDKRPGSQSMSDGSLQALRMSRTLADDLREQLMPEPSAQPDSAIVAGVESVA